MSNRPMARGGLACVSRTRLRSTAELARRHIITVHRVLCWRILRLTLLLGRRRTHGGWDGPWGLQGSTPRWLVMTYGAG
jgi:hypothetical protein